MFAYIHRTALFEVGKINKLFQCWIYTYVYVYIIEYKSLFTLNIYLNNLMNEKKLADMHEVNNRVRTFHNANIAFTELESNYNNPFLQVNTVHLFAICYNVAQRLQFLRKGSMGKYFICCRIHLKSFPIVRLKRWNNQWEFELDQAKSKNNIAENSFALGHETDNRCWFF